MDAQRPGPVAQYDIVAVGDCGLDLYAEVPRLPGHDEKVPGRFIGIFGGGVAANFACAAARLGARTALVSVVGADDFGTRAVATVAECGVDVSGIHVRSDAHTHFCFVCLDPSGEKALTIVRTAAFAPRWEDVSVEHLASARLVHVAPFDLDAAIRVAAYARSTGVPVSIDLEPGSALGGLDRLGPLLANTTILLPNQQCLETLFPGLRIEDAAAELRACGPDVVVATLGEQGALVVAEEGTVAVPAYRVSVTDTTGAGDCFSAAFVSEWLRGEDPTSAARFATAAAAISIQRFGARGDLPTSEGVAEFMRAKDGVPG
jgi:sugar/nucleoside kinase (ribokinase family)